MQNNYSLVRYVLRTSALATLIIGLSLIFFSAELVNVIAHGNGPNQHFAVYLGTALIGFAVTNWLYSKSSDLQTVLPAIYGNLASLLTASFIDAILLWFDRTNKAVWAILLIHLAFAAAFVYCGRVLAGKK